MYNWNGDESICIPMLNGPAILSFTKRTRFAVAGIAQRSSFTQLLFADASRQETGLEGRASNVLPFALLGNSDRLASIWRDAYLVEQRCAEDQLVAPRRNRVHAQSAPDIPGTHLTAILVAGQAIGQGRVQGVANAVDQLCCPVVFAHKRIQVSHVVAGLIPMCILANQAGDVCLIASGGFAARCEHGVQLRCITGSTAEKLNMAIDVVRNKEVVLPSIGFGVIEIHLPWIKCLEPCGGSFGLEEPTFRIQYVAVVQCPQPKPVHEFSICAVLGGKFGDAGIVKSIFQCFGNRFVFLIQGDVSQRYVGFKTEVSAVSRLHHSGNSQIHIKTANAPRISISDNRYAVVADHAPGVITGQFPNGQLTALFIHA